MRIICEDCKRECTLGIDGVVTMNGNKCDQCAGIVRGLGGFAFEENSSTPREQCCCLEFVGDNKDCPIHGSAS